MITVNQLSEILKDELGENVDNVTLCNWIDELVRDICREYGTIIKWEHAITQANIGISLPNDYMQTVKVLHNGVETTNYRITGYNVFVFPMPGKWEVYYLQVSPPITRNDGNAVPSVHEAFHTYFKNGLLYHYWMKESEADSSESLHAQRFYNMFLNDVRLAAQKLRGRKYPNELISVPDWW